MSMRGHSGNASVAFYQLRSRDLAKRLAVEFRADDERERATALEMADRALRGELPPRLRIVKPSPESALEPVSEIPPWARDVFEAVALQCFESARAGCLRALMWLAANGFVRRSGAHPRSRRSISTKHPLGMPARLTPKGEREAKILGFHVYTFAEAYNGKKYARRVGAYVRNAPVNAGKKASSGRHNLTESQP